MNLRKIKDYPYEIHDVDPQLSIELKEKFTGYLSGAFVQVGPKKYFFLKKFEEQAADYYSLPLRTDDVFVVSYPRTGTTVTQELVWLVANNADLDKVATVHLHDRCPFLEFSVLMDPVFGSQLQSELDQDSLTVHNRAPLEMLSELASPRFIKTHLPLSLLPPGLLDTARAVYVARDPRDAAVSYYHLHQRFTFLGFDGDFKTYWKYYVKGLGVYPGPVLEHLKEAWAQRHHPNMLFLFYDDVVKNPERTVGRVAQFLGKQLAPAQAARIARYLQFDNFKQHDTHDPPVSSEFINPNSQDFIRTGKSGGWREYFDEEMRAQAQRWLADGLRGTGLRFPD